MKNILYITTSYGPTLERAKKLSATKNAIPSDITPSDSQLNGDSERYQSIIPRIFSEVLIYEQIDTNKLGLRDTTKSNDIYEVIINDDRSCSIKLISNTDGE